MKTPMKAFMVGMQVTVRDNCEYDAGRKVKITNYYGYNKDYNCYELEADGDGFYEADFKEYDGNGTSPSIIYSTIRKSESSNNTTTSTLTFNTGIDDNIIEGTKENNKKEEKEYLSIENLLNKKLPILNTKN